MVLARNFRLSFLYVDCIICIAVFYDHSSFLFPCTRLQMSAEPDDHHQGGGSEAVGDDGFTQRERDQMNMTSAAFDALERDFREVLNDVRFLMLQYLCPLVS